MCAKNGGLIKYGNYESDMAGVGESRVNDGPFFGFSNWTDDNTIYYIGNAQGGELCRKKRTRIVLETAMTCSVMRDWVSVVELFSLESCIVGTQ